jgi:hypothetical protein
MGLWVLFGISFDARSGVLVDSIEKPIMMGRGDSPASATLTDSMWSVYHAGCDGMSTIPIIM